MRAAPVVIDTSAWIEYLVDTATGRTLARHWPDRDLTVVPSIVQLELAKWGMRELDEPRTDQIIAYTQKCRVANLDTRLALLAADIHREHRLATADAIVYATARHSGASLLTCDAHFDGLPAVLYEPKPRAETRP